MKLLIILLCIASERYLVHQASEYRSKWFDWYYEWISKQLPNREFLTNAYAQLALIILPLLLIFGLILTIFDNMLYGFVAFLLQFLIFYFCLGDENPFYPPSDESNSMALNYFAKVNNHLFAIIFWFIVTGPLGVITYRMLSFCTKKEATEVAASKILAGLDWITARVTVLLYLLVGNFQKGFQYYTQMFFASPGSNTEFLQTGGLLAAETEEGGEVPLPYAQILVEHALVVCLVFLALFTLAAGL